MQRLVTRPWITAGVALASAGMVTVTPVTAPPSAAAHVFDIQLTGDAEDITLDFVRHGQSTDDVNGILGTVPPGAPLTDLGQQQAADLAQAIQNEYPGDIAGIYASELIRTQETMAPLADALGMDVQVLPDLNEIPAGLFEGSSRNLINEFFFFSPMASWILGNLFVAEPGTTYNGVVFQEQVASAVQTMYDNTTSAGSDGTTAVASSSGGDIAIWTLMNVKNPDFWPLIQSALENGGPPPNAGQAILEGNPTDGWTLVSWDGTPVPQDPGLLTGLFVDWRDMNMAEQIALWNMWEAIQGGDQADITSALQTGYTQIVTAMQEFPQSVWDTLTGALGDSTGMAAGAAADSADSVADALVGAI